MARKMKDSGIEWIGEIPEEWETQRLKGCFSFGKGLPITKENLIEYGLAVISYGQIHSKQNNGTSIKNDLIRYVSNDYFKTNFSSCVHKGDFIFADTSEDLEGCGNCVYVDRKIQLFAGYHTIILFSKNEQCNKYLAYLFKTDQWRSQIRSRVSGVKLFSVSRKILADTTIILPNIKEQQRITDFLDKKCSDIDEILQKTKETVAEYKKLKQSVITQAVTKGVRGERPMKDSGIEWIGKIPEEWEVKKLKYCAIFAPNCDTKNLCSDTEVTFTPMECIHNGFFENRKSKFGLFNSSYTQYQEGDVVFAKVTPCFENGNIALMENLFSGFGFGSSELFVIRPTMINKKYLFYYLQNGIFKKMACSTMTGTGGLKRVSATFVKNYSVLLPKKNEQQEIAQYLDQKCAEIDELIAKKEQLVNELESYKKSLIYEYVTGKKEVNA